MKLASSPSQRTVSSILIVVHRSSLNRKLLQDIKTFSLRKLVVYIGFEGNGGVKRKGTRVQFF